MIRKYIKPLIIALTAFIALFVATGAYAGGYDLFMMPDAGKLNNPSTSVHMLYQMFGPLISDILNPSLNVNENGYLFAYMLKYWNFLIASGAGAFISFHLILAFVKSAENGKFLAGEAEKVGSILRYALGGFFVAPVIGTGKFCAMQMLFMYGILSGVHAANLLWGTATYGIQMGVTPTIPSNLTSTINTMAGEMYLYDMVDKYTGGTIQEASHLNGGGCPKGEDGKICLHTTGVQVVDLENQPGFESVGNALLNEHSYHYLNNLSSILRLYAASCVDKHLTVTNYIQLHGDKNCPAFDAWVLRHSVKHYEASTIKYSCNKDNCAGGASETLTQDSPPQCERSEHNIGVSAGSVVCNSDTDCNDNFKQSFCTKHTPSGCTPYKEKGGWSNATGKTVIVCTSPESLVPAVSTGHAQSSTYTCAQGYKLSTWDPSTYKVTQIDVQPGTGVCLPDMNTKHQYTNGEWVIDSGIDAIHFAKSPESTGISIVDASDRITTGVPKVAGFERAVLIDAGAPGVNQSDDITITQGGLVRSTSTTGEQTGENKKEAALIESLGMNLGPIASDYGFPIMAQSGSPLFYGFGVKATAVPPQSSCTLPQVAGTNSQHPAPGNCALPPASCASQDSEVPCWSDYPKNTDWAHCYPTWDGPYTCRG